MANADLDNPLGFVDKRRVSTTSAALVATPANFFSIGALRTRLAAFNGAYYTSARLDQMSDNDMVYALRVADEAGSL